MTATVLKIQYGDDTRRVSMEREPTFLELRKMTITFFKLNNFFIKYHDEDNDLITITSDSDLKEAFSIKRQPAAAIKFFVSKDEQNVSARPSLATSVSTTTNSPTSNIISSTPSIHGPFVSNQQLPLNIRPLVESVLSNPQITQLIHNSASSSASQIASSVIPQILSNAQLNTSTTSPSTSPSSTSTSTSTTSVPTPQVHTSVFAFNPLNPNGNVSSSLNLDGLNRDLENIIRGNLNGNNGSQNLLNDILNGLNGNTGSQNWLNDIIQTSLNSVFNNQQSQQSQEPHPESTTSKNDINNNNNNNNNEVVHEGITCDGCQQKVYGNRYKCTICEDYDLCSKCEAQGDKIHPSAHPLLKITKPIPVTCSWETDYQQPSYNKPAKCTRPIKKFASRYVSDISFKDGSVLYKGEQFTKVWRLRNDGEQQWPEGTTLQFLSGDRFGYHTNITVPPTLPGQDMDVSVDLVAPSKTGRYTGYWRLYDSDNVAFGQSIWVDVYVIEDAPYQQEYIDVAPKIPDSDDDEELEHQEEDEPNPLVDELQQLKVIEELLPSIEEDDDELKNETDSFCFLPTNVSFVSAPSPFSIPPPPPSSPSLFLPVVEQEPQEPQEQQQQQEQQEQQEPVAPLQVVEPAVEQKEPVAPLQVVEPVAPIDPQEDTKRKCIATLVSMGFCDTPNIIELIKKYNFNINQIVDHLLSEEQ